MSVGRLMNEMSSREFYEWMAFYKLHPFGEDRADLRTGIATAGIRNAWKSKGPWEKPSDHMIDFLEPDKRQTSVSGLQKAIMAMVNATGGKVIDNTNG